MKQVITFLVLLGLFGSLFGWVQTRILNERASKRVEEKILMLSDRPEVTKVLSLGFDNAIADILWIRAIQYFGGNFSSLDVKEKRDGLINLLNNLVGLDPHFIGAYKFGGFVINESIKEPRTAISFLMGGADENPLEWKLPFDAGFIAFYQLQEHEFAKDLFIQATYGHELEGLGVSSQSGLAPTSNLDGLLDGDPYTASEFEADSGSFVISLDERKPVGRVVVQQQSGNEQTYRLQYSARTNAANFIDKETVTMSGLASHSFTPAVWTENLKFDQFTTTGEHGLFSLNNIKVYGERNPTTPAYVERMIFEMDRASGRFLASWEQYQRYYQEALDKGDTISAELALTKLDDIYTAKSLQLLETAAIKYIEANDGKLPSPNMKELVEEGFLQTVIEEEKAADPQFEPEVLRVLIPQGGSLWDILTGMDGETQHILLPTTDIEDERDWILSSMRDLQKGRQSRIQIIQAYVDQYKEEYGTNPASVKDLLNEPWFQNDEDLFSDVLGGEYYVDQQTGQVNIRDTNL